MNFLLSFYRSMTRNLLYTTLNALGLAVGIAVFLLLAMIVRYENGYNRWVPDARQIFRLDTTVMLPGQSPLEFAESPFLLLGLIREDFPQVAAGSRTLERRYTVTAGTTLGTDYVSLVDANFLSVIALPLAEGNPAAALSSPSAVVLSQSIALKYFGTEHAVGRSLVLTEGNRKRDVTVSAIMRDMPADTTLQFRILIPFGSASDADYPWRRDLKSDSVATFLRFRNVADAHAVSENLTSFVNRRLSGGGADRRPADRYVLSLIGLTDMHFHDLAVVGAVSGVDRHVVYSLGAVGTLALVIAAINYVNLATARAGLRAREVALRKVMGATRAALFTQFMSEALLLVALSGLIGLATVELTIPLVNAAGDWSLNLDYGWALAVLAVVVLGVTVGAGCYPAILLARFQPASVLAASRFPSAGRLDTRLRTLLVLLQFVASIAFAICTLVTDEQARFLRTADRGFEQQGLILVLSTSIAQLTSRQASILEQMRAVPGVVSATLSNGIPRGGNFDMLGVKRPGMAGQQPSLAAQIVAADYFQTMGVPLVAGRLFDSAHGTDDAARALSSTSAGDADISTIISRKAVSSLGYADPQAALGKHFRVDMYGRNADLTIIGVAGDVRFESARQPVPPQFYIERTDAIDNAPIVARFSGVARDEVTQRLQAVWRRMAPDEPFRAQSVEDRLSDFYQPDQRRATLFSAGAALAIVIACVGLYGLASFNTARRTREIGIRKTLGASTAQVLALLVGQFIRPVLLANLVAWPIAWVIMGQWLSGFDERIALSPVPFLEATAAALAISVATVIGQAARIARAEPAQALRYE